MKRYFFWLFVLVFPLIAYADDLIPVDVFLNQLLQSIAKFGGMGWGLKVAAIITLIVSSMKVSFLKPIWDKLGWAKILIAPLLSLVGALIAYFTGGVPFVFSDFMAYLFVGGGSIIMHELLDALKQMPWIGDSVKAVITLIENSFLGSIGSRK